MNRAMKFAQQAMSYTHGVSLYGTPQEVLLQRIADKVERIQKLGFVSEAERGEALSVAWDAYAKVLKTVNSGLDESWGGATRGGGVAMPSKYRPAVQIIDDEQLASLLLYGHADYDGVRDD